MIKHYVVEGMTSEENGTSVETEITDLPGTQGVEVDVATGTVSVTGEGFTDADIAHAVESAGFVLRLED
ncbi:heavy-metal-associated domain-containing protein [Corynebacterium hylobatis]|uniref:Heavy-metal-associated domain-containing protein n=1 Tax=Corynebacterium hylobatis TaxID=1859290 RepID=A0A3R9ZCY8_9CORY|nr:heavy metal-associated domain-containing protein [Corynebacterium hylobatis]RSZ61447.1 heavy-metal-associated domain-containing protein [Corynebacterium hylobatis]